MPIQLPSAGCHVKEKANSPSKSQENLFMLGPTFLGRKSTGEPLQDDLIQESIDMAMDVESDELRGTNLKSPLV